MLYVSDPSNNVGLTNWASSGQCGQKMDECCNMADQGCCVNEGQKCYTVWEKQCQYVNKPQCQTMFRQKCQNVLIKGCAKKDIFQDVVSAQKGEVFREIVLIQEIPVQDCQVSTEKRCWTYDKKMCQPKLEDFTRTFKYGPNGLTVFFSYFHFLSWTNERLVGGSEPRQLCAKVRKCNIEEKTQTKVTKVPERKCDNIPYNRQVCRAEQVQDPPQMVSVRDTVSEKELF